MDVMTFIPERLTLEEARKRLYKHIEQGQNLKRDGLLDYCLSDQRGAQNIGQIITQTGVVVPAFVTRRARKRAPDNDEAKKLRAKVVNVLNLRIE